MCEWRPDRLDEILDEALSSYSDVPQRAGLQQRVLANINKRTHQRPLKQFLKIMGAVAAAVCCLLWWTVSKATTSTHPVITTVPKIKTPEEAALVRPLQTSDSISVSPRLLKRRTSSHKQLEPKLATFPTPSPMDNEERALLQLVAENPKDIPHELTHFGDPIEPLHVTAIEIKPLE